MPLYATPPDTSLLQDVTDKQHRGYFVDLFVRVSNAVAINMYTKASSGGARTCLCLTPAQM